MEASPRKMGEGDLKFSPTRGGGVGGLAKWGVSNFSHFWGDNRLFSTEGMGRVPPSLVKNLLIPPPPGKVPPSRLLVPNLDKKYIWLSDSAHFQGTLTKI